MTKFLYWLRFYSIKIFHWEYWDSTIIYLPIMPYLGWLLFKARSIFFFNAANPGIEYGGFLMESKWTIYTNAPQGFFPATLLIKPAADFNTISSILPAGIGFPLIAKPDIGSKGRGVSIIQNMQQWAAYHSSCPIPYIIQEKINYSHEAGIFYVRMPGEASGKITGIVQKEYIKVTGDGRSSLRQLLTAIPRYFLQLKKLEQLLGHLEMSSVIPNGTTRTLIEIGNHARGATFTNAADKITDLLTATIDKLCKKLNHFYYGRLDIRFQDWESLEKGAHFAVIEVNGSGSEPTHIYDPSSGIFAAWMEICRHWTMMFEISTLNHKNGTAYLNWKEAGTMFRNNARLNRKLTSFENQQSAVSNQLSVISCQ